MKIAILGPGAMGCLFALRLSQANHEVHLVDYNFERMNRLNSAGITVESASGEIHGKVAMAHQVPPDMELILVLTKAYVTAELQLPDEVPILTLQNGLNNAEQLSAKWGSARILAGTTTEAATLLGEGRVRHASAGCTKIGSWTSCPTEGALHALEQAGFEVAPCASPGQAIWEKTAISASINPLTAILNVPNGELLKRTETRQLMRDLVVEATKVASTEGYRFDHSLVEQAEQVCEETSENISSMLQDIRAGRETEIDAISGEILRRASLASLPTPRTRVIFQVVRSLEKQ
jgi:2-dehydropantoate 2-reductase